MKEPRRLKEGLRSATQRWRSLKESIIGLLPTIAEHSKGYKKIVAMILAGNGMKMLAYRVNARIAA